MSPTPVIVISTSDQLEVHEVVDLYRSVGWALYADDPVVLMAALRGSSWVVSARRAGELVGLARVISDGATICYLQDILVRPEVQRQRVGRNMLDAALQPYRGVRQQVVLTDDEPAQRAFYESSGFAETRDFGDGTLRAFVKFGR